MGVSSTLRMSDTELLTKFHDARTSNNKEAYLAVSEDCEVETPKGKWKGTAELTKFLDENQYTEADGPNFSGDWTVVEPGHYSRKGTIKKLMMNWTVTQDVWVANGKVVKSVLKQG